VGGVKFTLLTAYKTITGGILIGSVKVEAGAEPITTNPKLWSYRGPDGKPVAAVGSSGATYVIARSSAIVWMNFGLVKAGGSISVGGCPSKDCPSGSFSGVLKVA
jgi:hypothetical protein